ncbi:MAG: LacI family DNA-binding transcriptional regulator [Actinobacteria bacterium]|nr:LacI family DNA-binding transcriptional regulator [Actinomycetota bacterium]
MVFIVTIKDIAKQAGVSVATVSHVINKTRFVSDVLQERVKKTIEDLDYQPNTMAGSLRTRKTKVVGLIVPDNSNPLFAALSMLVEQVSSSLNYNVLLCNSSYDLKIELSCIQLIRSKRVDGLIIIPTTTNKDHINQLIENKLPVVVLHHIITGCKADSVVVNNFKGTYEATIHLIDLDHRHIGYIDRPVSLPHSLERLNGYRKALEERGIRQDDNVIRCNGFNYNDGSEAIEKLLKLKPDITAILAFNDTIAMGAIRTINDHGLGVPDDISVVGFDDVELCSFITPRLTTVHFPKYKMAKSAVDFLLKRMENPEIKRPIKKVLPLNLIIRESTSKVKK